MFSEARKEGRRRARWFLAVALPVVAGNALLAGPLQPLHGLPVKEWPVAIDLLILLPLLYLWTYRKRGKAALAGAAMLFGFGVLVGSWILPLESQRFWPWLVELRVLLLVALVAGQAALIAMVVREALHGCAGANLEARLDAAITRRFGEDGIAPLMRLEARLWAYSLARRPVRCAFPGEAHFLGAMQNGNASSQQAFLILIGAGIPLEHVVVHLFNPTAAWVLTALSVYGFLFLLAEYRATLLRPISLDGRTLRLRHGIALDLEVPMERIASIEPCSGTARRVAGRVRAYGMGQANVRIVLRPGTRLRGLFGENEVAEILLGLDDQKRFLQMLAPRIGSECRQGSSPPARAF